MRVETRTRAAIALVLTCTSAVAAQEPAVFRAGTDVVLVPISVTDRNGRFVHGLTSEHFEIWEGGTRRAVKQFSAARVPVSLGILLDISGSMMQEPDARAADDAFLMATIPRCMPPASFRRHRMTCASQRPVSAIRNGRCGHSSSQGRATPCAGRMRCCMPSASVPAEACL